MERKLLRVTWRDKITNNTMKERKKACRRTAERKWAGHAARATDNWANDLLKWAPSGKGKRGRPKTRWKDHVVAGRRWTDMAKDRQKWSSQRDTFAQQWERDG